MLWQDPAQSTCYANIAIPLVTVHTHTYTHTLNIKHLLAWTQRLHAHFEQDQIWPNIKDRSLQVHSSVGLICHTPCCPKHCGVGIDEGKAEVSSLCSKKSFFSLNPRFLRPRIEGFPNQVWEYLDSALSDDVWCTFSLKGPVLMLSPPKSFTGKLNCLLQEALIDLARESSTFLPLASILL